MNISTQILSNNSFFILGIKKLLHKEKINNYHAILDLDNMSHADTLNLICIDQDIVAFASNDLSSLNVEKFGGMTILDKRCSIKDILNYFTLKKQCGIYHATTVFTPREKEIFHLLKKGISHSEISHNLNIKNKTIYTYRRNIMKKLCCKNRIEFQKKLLEI